MSNITIGFTGLTEIFVGITGLKNTIVHLFSGSQMFCQILYVT